MRSERGSGLLSSLGARRNCRPQRVEALLRSTQHRSPIHSHPSVA